MSKKVLAVMLSVILAVAIAAVPASAGLLDFFSGATKGAEESSEGAAPSENEVAQNVETDTAA